jgi:hypothetical protein
MNLEFKAQEPGKYQVTLINGLGQVVHSSIVLVDGNSKKQQILLGASANPGQYNLSVTSPNGNKTLQAIFVE